MNANKKLQTRKLQTMVAVVSLLCVGSAFADLSGRRDANQQQRIGQGVASGELTAREAATLERGQVHSERVEARAAADGKITPAERAHIHAVDDRQSQRIFNKKHNERTQ